MNEKPNSPDNKIDTEILINRIKSEGLTAELQKMYADWVEQEQPTENDVKERMKFTMRKGELLYDAGIYDSALIEYHVLTEELSHPLAGLPDDVRENLLRNTWQWIYEIRDKLEEIEKRQ
jgi:hypothetical protein